MSLKFINNYEILRFHIKAGQQGGGGVPIADKAIILLTFHIYNKIEQIDNKI
jgi:hypothetical protein